MILIVESLKDFQLLTKGDGIKKELPKNCWHN